MIYVTGDTHGDFTRFSTKEFPEQKKMTRDDIVIILGDFGGVWKDDAYERYWLDWLNEKPFTLCYVDGNHENYDRYYHTNEFEIVDFHGGKAQKVRDNIYHLLRGFIFNFEGKKFFCMGGASSHDISDGILDINNFESLDEFSRVCKQMRNQNKLFRINHISWWKEELPSQIEMDFGEKTLSEAEYKVDYIISHCLPQSIASIVGYYTNDSLTEYFDKLLQNGLQFNSWWCGHYHTNDRILGKYHILYKTIVRIA